MPNKLSSKLLAVLCSLALIFSSLPLVATAADDDDDGSVIYNMQSDTDITGAADGSDFGTTTYLTNSGGGPKVVAYQEGKSIHVASRTDNWNGVDIRLQALDLIAGLEYTFTVTGHIAVDPPDGSQLVSLNPNAFGQFGGYSGIAPSVPMTNGNFTIEYKITFTPSDIAAIGDNSYFRTQSNDTGKAVPFFVDNIVITQGPVPVVYDMQEDPGIADVDAGTEFTWTNYLQNSGGTRTIVENNDGSRSIQISNREGDWNGVDIKLSALGLTSDKEYTFTITGHLDSSVTVPDPNTYAIVLSTPNAFGSYNQYQWLTNQPLTNNSVTLQYKAALTNSDIASIGNDSYFRIQTNGDAANVPFFVDSILITALPSAVDPAVPEWDLSLDSLYEAFEDDFLFGNIMSPQDVDNEEFVNMYKHHYNVVTAENHMKPEAISPSKDVYNYTNADKLVDWAIANNIEVHGHTLIWHSQTADWLNKGENSQPLTRAEAKANLNDYIENVAGHYQGKLLSWDVVNEAFADGGSFNGNWKDNLRLNSPWYLAYANGADAGAGESGADYIYDAFVKTRLVDPDATLYYNDYNEESPTKRDAIASMVEELNEKWADDDRNTEEPNRLLIEGIGMQSHHFTDSLSAENIENAIKRFIETGAKVTVSELDIPYGNYSNFENRNTPFLNQAEQISQAQKYAQVFQIYKKYAESIERVTIWGIADQHSWRARGNPLIFDRLYAAKEAYNAVMDPDGYIEEHPLPQPQVIPEAYALPGAPDIDGEADAVWGDAPAIHVNTKPDGQAQDAASAVVKTLWDEEYLYVYAEVSDSELDNTSGNPWEQDSVEVFLSETLHRGSEYKDGDGQYRVTYEGNESFKANSMGDGFVSSAKIVEGGYTVEMKIPFRVIEPASGTKVGFDVQLNDASASNSRLLTVWSDLKANGYNSTENWGELTLVEELPPVAPAGTIYHMHEDEGLTVGSNFTGTTYLQKSGLDTDVSSVVSYNGGKSIYLSTRGANWAAVDIKLSSLGLTAGNEYSFTISGHPAGAVSTNSLVLLSNPNPWGNFGQYSEFAETRTPLVEGESFSFTYTVTFSPSDIAALTNDSLFRIGTNNGNSDLFYIDNIVITETPPPPVYDMQEDAGLTVGSNFTGTAYLQKSGLDTDVSSVVSNNGGKSIYLSTRGANWAAVDIKLSSLGLTAGNEYTFTVSGRPAGAVSANAQVLLSNPNPWSNFGEYSEFAETRTPLVAGESFSFTYTVTFTSGDIAALANNSLFRIGTNNGNSDLFYIDNIVITSKVAPGPVEEPEWDLSIDSLYEAYEDYFLFGNIASPNQVDNDEFVDMYKHHYNVVTAENHMKPEALSSTKDIYNFTNADKLVNWALANNIEVHGHTLIWHSQTADWLNKGENNQPLTRADAKKNLENYIESVAGYYAGKLLSWDVVNEAFADGGSFNGNWKDNLRLNSPWYLAYANGADTTAGESGADYIYDAFVQTRLVDPDAILYYNDYNEESPTKRDAIASMVEELNEKWADDERNTNPNRLLIEGIGMQSHHFTDSLSIENIENAIKRFIETGAKVTVSELDIPYGTYSNFENRNTPFLTQEEQIAQAQRYAQVFQIYKKYAESIERVTIWGIADQHSWRARGNPLIFDRLYAAKEAYYAVMDPDGYIEEHPLPQPQPIPQAYSLPGTPEIDGEADDLWADAPVINVNKKPDGQAQDAASAVVKTLWDEEYLYVYVDVSDSELNSTSGNPWEQDSVEVFLSETLHRGSEYKDGDGQYRVTYEGDKSFKSDSMAEGFASSAKIVDGGYIVEMKIPFRVIEPAAGTKVGFDVQLNDASASNSRLLTVWSDLKANGYNSTENWGNLTLVDEVPELPPATPTNLSATALGTSSIKLDWDDATEDGVLFYVLRSESTAENEFEIIADDLEASEFTDTGLSASTTYYYIVVAAKGGLVSEDFAIVHATTQDEVIPVLLPAIPEGVTATSLSASSIKLDWSDASEVGVTFSVYRSAAQAGPYTEVASLLTASEFTNTGLTSSTTYYYKVNAVKGELVSEDSEIVHATTQDEVIPVLPPAIPEGVTATTLSASSIKLDWADATEVGVTFSVYRASAQAGPYTEVASQLTASEFTNTGLASSTTYYYKVTAVKGDLVSEDSAIVHATTSAAAPIVTTITDTTEPPIDNKEGQVTITPKVELQGNTASTSLSSNSLNKALEQATSNDAGKKQVVVEIPAQAGATSYVVQVPTTSLKAADSTVISIKTANGTIDLPGNMLANSDAGNADNVSIRLAQGSTAGLSDAIREEIGNRPVISLEVLSGDSVIAWNNPNAPVTVSVPYTPTAEELENPDAIVIWYIDGQGVATVVPNARYDVASGTVIFKTTHFSNYAVVFDAKTFGDLASVPWAKQAIEAMASRGIITGTSATGYSPEASIKRADFVLLLVRALELRGTSGTVEAFDDVAASAYYAEAVNIARQLGIVQGKGNNQFGPDDRISRQDMMVLAMRALTAAGAEPTASGSLTSFSDAPLVSGYARNSAAALATAGIVTGSNGKLDPQGTLTRAEAAVILYRLWNRI